MAVLSGLAAISAWVMLLTVAVALVTTVLWLILKKTTTIATEYAKTHKGTSSRMATWFVGGATGFLVAIRMAGGFLRRFVVHYWMILIFMVVFFWGFGSLWAENQVVATKYVSVVYSTVMESGVRPAIRYILNSVLRGFVYPALSFIHIFLSYLRIAFNTTTFELMEGLRNTNNVRRAVTLFGTFMSSVSVEMATVFISGGKTVNFKKTGASVASMATLWEDVGNQYCEWAAPIWASVGRRSDLDALAGIVDYGMQTVVNVGGVLPFVYQIRQVISAVPLKDNAEIQAKVAYCNQLCAQYAIRYLPICKIVQCNETNYMPIFTFRYILTPLHRFVYNLQKYASSIVDVFLYDEARCVHNKYINTSLCEDPNTGSMGVCTDVYHTARRSVESDTDNPGRRRAVFESKKTIINEGRDRFSMFQLTGAYPPWSWKSLLLSPLRAMMPSLSRSYGFNFLAVVLFQVQQMFSLAWAVTFTIIPQTLQFALIMIENIINLIMSLLQRGKLNAPQDLYLEELFTLMSDLAKDIHDSWNWALGNRMPYITALAYDYSLVVMGFFYNVLQGYVVFSQASNAITTKEWMMEHPAYAHELFPDTDTLTRDAMANWYNRRMSPWDATCNSCFDAPYTEMELLLKGVSISDIQSGIYSNISRNPDLWTWTTNFKRMMITDIGKLWQETGIRAGEYVTLAYHASQAKTNANDGPPERTHHTRGIGRRSRRAIDEVYISYAPSMEGVTNCSSPSVYNPSLCLVETPPLKANWRVDMCTAFGCMPDICLTGHSTLPTCCYQDYDRCFSLDPKARVSNRCYQGETTHCSPVYRTNEDYGLTPRACLFAQASECCYLPTESPFNTPRIRIPEECFAATTIGIPSYCTVRVTDGAETASRPLVSQWGELYPKATGSGLVNVSMDSVCSPTFDYAHYLHTPVDCMDKSNGIEIDACCTNNATGELWPTLCFHRNPAFWPNASLCAPPPTNDTCRVYGTRRVMDLITPIVGLTTETYFSGERPFHADLFFARHDLSDENAPEHDASADDFILVGISLAIRGLAKLNEWLTIDIYWILRIIMELLFNIEHNADVVRGALTPVGLLVQEAVDTVEAFFVREFEGAEALFMCDGVELIANNVFTSGGCKRTAKGDPIPSFTCFICNFADTAVLFWKETARFAEKIYTSVASEKNVVTKYILTDITAAGGLIQKATRALAGVPLTLFTFVENATTKDQLSNTVTESVVTSLLDIVDSAVETFLGVTVNVWLAALDEFIVHNEVAHNRSRDVGHGTGHYAPGTVAVGKFFGYVATYIIRPLGDLVFHIFMLFANIITGGSATTNCPDSGAGMGCLAGKLRGLFTTIIDALEQFANSSQTIISKIAGLFVDIGEMIVHVVTWDLTQAAKSFGTIIGTLAQLFSTMVTSLAKEIWTAITKAVGNFGNEIWNFIKHQGVINDFRNFMNKCKGVAWTKWVQCMVSRRRDGSSLLPPVWVLADPNGTEFYSPYLKVIGQDNPGGEYWVRDRVLLDYRLYKNAWGGLDSCSAIMHWASQTKWSDLKELHQIAVARCLSMRDMQQIMVPDTLQDEFPFNFGAEPYSNTFVMATNMANNAWTILGTAGLDGLSDLKKMTEEAMADLLQTEDPTALYKRTTAYILVRVRDYIFLTYQSLRTDIIPMENGVPTRRLIPEAGMQWVRRAFHTSLCETTDWCEVEYMQKVPVAPRMASDAAPARRALESADTVVPTLLTPVRPTTLPVPPPGGWPSDKYQGMTRVTRDSTTDSARTTSGEPPCSFFQKTKCNLIDRVAEQLEVHSANVKLFYETTFAYTMARTEDVIDADLGNDNVQHPWPQARQAWPGFQSLPFRQSLVEFLPTGTLDYTDKVVYELDRTDPVHGSVYSVWEWGNRSLPLWNITLGDDPLYYSKKILEWVVAPKEGLVQVLDDVFICKERLDWENQRRIKNPWMAAFLAVGLFALITYILPGGRALTRLVGLILGGSLSIQTFYFLAYGMAFACNFNPLSTVSMVATRYGLVIPLAANAVFSPIALPIPPPILINDFYDGLQNVTENPRIQWTDGFVTYAPGAAVTDEPDEVFDCGAKGRFEDTLYAATWWLHYISPSLLRFVVKLDWLEFILPSSDYYERWENDADLSVDQRAFPTDNLALECAVWWYSLVAVAIIWTLLVFTVLSSTLTIAVGLMVVSMILFGAYTLGDAVALIGAFANARKPRRLTSTLQGESRPPPQDHVYLPASTAVAYPSEMRMAEDDNTIFFGNDAQASSVRRRR